MKTGIEVAINPKITTTEDEKSKRNTDCVYFLASPLTCKKGRDCEYRHSEEARMNPRDCWYWMNGNCLNPKCSFRHPPLDGLLGTSVGTLAKPSLPPSLAASSMQLPRDPVSNLGKQANLHKQATPCYYFQKGLCLKGDRCPFMHEPSQEHAAITPISINTEPQIPKKPMIGLKRCRSQQQSIQQDNIVKRVEVPSAPKPAPRPQIVPSRNGLVGKTTMPQATNFKYEMPRYRPPNVHLRVQNVKESDEFVAYSSPGIDVLVNDELRQYDGYRNEDGFETVTGHEGRNVNNTTNDFGFKQSSHCYPGKFDETYNDSRNCESYGRVQGQYFSEQRKPSFKRTSERPILLERSGYSKDEISSQVDTSDLQNRLKHRKVNESRSVVTHDRRGEFYRSDDRDRSIGDQRFYDHSRRDFHSTDLREGSTISNRLHGRVKLPGRSSSDSNNNEYHHERELESGLHDRIKRRTNEDFSAERRNCSILSVRREEVDNTSNFAGPKRLAELKGTKVSNENHQKKTETRKLVTYGGSDDILSFEGPKPLNVILKRKRETGSSGDDAISGNEEETSRRRKSELLSSSRARGAAEQRNEVQFESKSEEEEKEGVVFREGDEVEHDNHSSVLRKSDLQDKDATVTDDLEEEEFETSDQRNWEPEYEGDVDFNAVEDDFNVEGEEGFSEDDDGDDFAKRIGEMYS